MPRKRRTTNQPVSATFCAERTDYVKLKVENKISDTTSLIATPEQVPVPGDQLTRPDENYSDQGHGLTDAVARPNAQARSWAGDLMSKNGFESAPNLASALGIALENGNTAICKINYELYREFFDDQSISDEEKDQVIDFLFYFGNCFYDAGFAPAPLGQACGKLDENEDEPAEKNQNMVGSATDTLTKTFNGCAA